jgi:hypothetical protein
MQAEPRGLTEFFEGEFTRVLEKELLEIIGSRACQKSDRFTFGAGLHHPSKDV